MRIHIIQKGDTLSEIAKQYDIDYETLVKSNPQIANPEIIVPGMKLQIPQQMKKISTDNKGKKTKSGNQNRVDKGNKADKNPMKKNRTSGEIKEAAKPEIKNNQLLFTPQERPLGREDQAWGHRDSTTNEQNKPAENHKKFVRCSCCHRPMYMES